ALLYPFSFPTRRSSDLDGHEAFFCVVGRLLHRTQPHPVTPDHSVHEPPFLFSWCGRVAGEAQISRPRAREAAVFPCDPDARSGDRTSHKTGAAPLQVMGLASG